MKPIYKTPLFAKHVIETIIDNFSKQKKLITNEVIRKTYEICKNTGFKYKQSCRDCLYISPEELSSLIKEYGIEDSLTSPEKALKIARRVRKRDLKLIKKSRNALRVGLVCVNYSGKEGGVILTQEYYAEIPFLSSEKPDNPSFSLGPMGYFGYGIWDGKEEEIFGKKCRDNLDIPENDVISKINLPQIMK